MGFRIKRFIALIFDYLGISNLLIKCLNKKYKNEYIRIINYHDVLISEKENFEQQLKFYKDNFSNINYDSFTKFLDGDFIIKEKPGIMITFDDGYKGNYSVAADLLDKYNLTGYFMISSDLVGKENYMTIAELKDLISRGHVIGDHTATHHRMNSDDSDEILNYEINTSKIKLEEMLECPVDIFCWCGGEEKHYTKSASDIIKKTNYKYGFMTNSFPVTSKTNHFQIQRTNIESGWSLSLLKFQISGFMDKKYEKKRNRVNKITR